MDAAITGPVADNPRRLGKPLNAPLTGWRREHPGKGAGEGSTRTPLLTLKGAREQKAPGLVLP